MAKKNFDYAKGKYYLNINSGIQSITLHRDNKKTAELAYLNYLKIGKSCEWLGKWDGKKFSDNKAPKKPEMA